MAGSKSVMEATVPPRSRLRPVLRAARWLVLAYAGAVIGFQVLVLAGVGVTRALGHDTRQTTIATVQNLRPVDDRVWASGQPDEVEYRDLAANGVRLVVDLRTGAPDDPTDDDSANLAELGVERLHLRVPDGHVMTAAQVETLLTAVGDVDGLVLLHCGGGVGRSNTASAAYLAARGRDPSVLEAMAVGPMTLEQLWYIATAEAGEIPADDGPLDWTIRRVSRLLDAPRRALSEARAGDLLATAGLAVGAVVVGASLVSVLVAPSRRAFGRGGPPPASGGSPDGGPS